MCEEHLKFSAILSHFSLLLCITFLMMQLIIITSQLLTTVLILPLCQHFKYNMLEG